MICFGREEDGVNPSSYDNDYKTKDSHYDCWTGSRPVMGWARSDINFYYGGGLLCCIPLSSEDSTLGGGGKSKFKG